MVSRDYITIYVFAYCLFDMCVSKIKNIKNRNDLLVIKFFLINYSILQSFQSYMATHNNRKIIPFTTKYLAKRDLL